MNSCPICYESVLQINTATPDVCDHIFCLTCLTKWSKHESFCPIDRKRFKKIIRFDSKSPIEIKRHKRKKASPLYDVTAYCEICKTSERGDTLLLCDCCDLGYHCACLTPKLQSVPPGRWFCPTCVSVDEKLKKKKGVEKAPKSNLRNKKPEKRSYPRPGTSNMFSRSSNNSISTTSVPNKSSSDLEIQPKKLCSYTSQDLKDRFNISDDFKSKRRSSNNISLNQSQNNGVIVSDQDYHVLNNYDNVFILPDVSISPKSVSSKSHTTSTRKEGSTRTKNKFSVFEKSDNFSTRPKCRRILDFSEANGSDSEVSCDVSETPGISRSCSVSSNTSGKENCNLNQQCDQPQLNTKSTGGPASSVCKARASHRFKTKFDESVLLSRDCEPNSVDNLTMQTERNRPSLDSGLLLRDGKFRTDDCESTPSPEQKSEVPSACGKDKSSLYQGLDELKCSESDSQPKALHGYGLNKTEVDESYVLENPLVDFESRNSQYALKAKLNLQEELQKMEQEKWQYFKPLKKLKSLSFTQKDCENLLDFPKRRTSVVEEKTKSGLGCNVFNIEEYKERVRKGTWCPENIVILERNKNVASDKHRLKIQMKKQMRTCCSLNVFQVPDSQNEFVANKKRQGYMTSFNPLHSKSGRRKFAGNLLQTALHTDLEDLSIRKDGSLFLNWTKCTS